LAIIKKLEAEPMNKELDINTLLNMTTLNSDKIHGKTQCCCISCGELFLGEEIHNNIIENPYIKLRTALCPYCGMDTVVSEEMLPEGFILNKEFAAQLHQSYNS